MVFVVALRRSNSSPQVNKQCAYMAYIFVALYNNVLIIVLILAQCFDK